MPEATESELLQAVRDLLREGRTTEADRALNAIQEQIRLDEEKRKRDIPPPTPQTIAELESAFKKTVTDLLGNNPRLSALLVELEGKSKAAE
jgi:hypothetical protein